ncbi:MAG TPA: hypothetical protein VFG86_19840 [Chloroflexota bacterium]|nr:hypothetical protein [Chloroflexota bacterium]
MVDELVFESNDGAGTYTISAPKGKKRSAADQQAIDDEAEATKRNAKK